MTKLVLVPVALAFEFSGITARISALGVSVELLIFAALYAGLALCLWGAAFIRRSWLRWGWALVLALAATLVGSFQGATADAMSYDAFVTMVHSAGFAGDAFTQHRGSIAWATAGAMILFVAIGLKPGSSPRVPRFVAALAPLTGLMLLSLLLFFRGGEGARGLPNAWVGAAYSTLYLFEAATSPSLSRQPVTIAHLASPTQGDIILIIDESIAAQYLDINDDAGVRSGLASPPAGVFASNFGLAASVTHCSFGSNLTLRFGGTRQAYHQINSTMPSIFAYAKRAGFKTVYIDAQRVGGDYQNGMDEAERQDIDHMIQFDDIRVVDRDMAAANTLIAALNNDRRDFILVNKMGAHFPVADKYPDSANIYRPALPRGQTANVAEMQLPENLYSGTESWRLYRNSYRNTVAWTVGGFFDRLFAWAKLDNALIIYTSDHGQNLHERGDSGTTTHCSSAPASEEGTVPLVVIDTKNSWQDAAARNFDASSHYRIFPTLLNAMGYDPKAVEQHYGAALDSTARDPMTFNSLYHARLGRKPQWVKVRRETVARPPVGDHEDRPEGTIVQ